MNTLQLGGEFTLFSRELQYVAIYAFFVLFFLLKYSTVLYFMPFPSLIQWLVKRDAWGKKHIIRLRATASNAARSLLLMIMSHSVQGSMQKCRLKHVVEIKCKFWDGRKDDWCVFFILMMIWCNVIANIVQIWKRYSTHNQYPSFRSWVLNDNSSQSSATEP